MVVHKSFLYWLIYISCVIIASSSLTFIGITELIIASDYSRLTLVLIAMYFLAEILAGIQAWSVSKQHQALSSTLCFMEKNKLVDLRITGDSVHFCAQDETVHILGPSPYARFVIALKNKAENGPTGPINARVLLDNLADKLYLKTNIGDFVSSRIVWVGIFATIVGVILSFWPFMTSGFDAETIQRLMPDFFAGVAVAFIPTAASFVFKIALDINTRILAAGVSDTLDIATVLTEAHVVPFLETRAR